MPKTAPFNVTAMLITVPLGRPIAYDCISVQAYHQWVYIIINRGYLGRSPISARLLIDRGTFTEPEATDYPIYTQVRITR